MHNTVFLRVYRADCLTEKLNLSSDTCISMVQLSWNKHKHVHFHNTLLAKENKELILYAIVLFVLPLFPLNQLVAGTIINALLIKTAITYKSNKVFLLSIIPSTGALAGGILFSNLASQLILMLPIIWLGNLTIMFLMKSLYTKKGKEFFYSALFSGTAKTILLFSASVFLFSQSLVPVLFLTMFGINQLITAEAGAILVAATNYIAKEIF